MNTDSLANAGPLLLVGCGKMGGALLQGWLQEGLTAENALIVEPALDPERIQLPDGVSAFGSADELPDDFAPEVIIFAVKPQAMADVVPLYVRYVSTGTAFLSIAAGTPISFFENHLGAEAAIVRVMPNTPAAIGRGVSVLCANANTDSRQKALCGDLLAAVGGTSWLEDESLMDAVTAVSGSGPAYVFLLIECLAEAAREVGLEDAMARQLALETVAGAGELARQATEDPSQLRVNVTSPGGTTAAALEILMAPDGLQKLMSDAVKAAENRGRELGS
jgi:pyrroline-5-carboxylate reductase